MLAGSEATDILRRAKAHVSTLLNEKYGTDEALPLWRAYRLLAKLTSKVIKEEAYCVRGGCGKPVTHWEQVRNEEHGYCEGHGIE